MLTIWTKNSSAKVISSLSPVLKHHTDLPVHVSNTFSVPEGTQLIFALGSDALAVLQEQKIVAKNRTITSLRTKPVLYGKTPVLLSYSSDIGDMDYRYYVDLLTDLNLAIRYCETGTFEAKLGNYKYVPDFSELIAGIKKKHEETQKPVDLMMDLETVGFDPYKLPDLKHPGAYIVTIQACYELGEACAVRFGSRGEEEKRLADPEFKAQLVFLLTCPYIRLKGANLKFDLHWLWVRAAIDCTNFSFDTTIVGSLNDENRSNALDVHTKLYSSRGAAYSDNFDRTFDKSRMDLIPPEQLLPYACGDVDFGLEVAHALKQELMQDAQLTRFYVNILHPASRAFEKIERGGVFVDKEAYKELKSDLETEQASLIKRACKIMGGRIVAKHMDPSRIGGMNLTKASMLCDFMFSPMGLNLKPKMFTAKPDKDGNVKPSTAMEHLEMFSNVPEAKEFVSILREYAGVTKTYNTYVVGFLEHLRSDGKFHPTYFLHAGNRDAGDGGTSTGRLSAKDPAFQTIPSHTKWAKRIKRCFPAPPGYLVLQRDFSQGELRVVACVACEENMILAYQQGMDLHALTGGSTAGYDYAAMMELKKTNKELYGQLRQLAKAMNFGLLYGMGAEGFQAYAATSYGVVISLDKAVEARSAFFEKYPRLLTYHDAYKNFARRNGYVRGPLGRIKHLPLIHSKNREEAAKEERRAINAPIQGCLSDMLIWSAALEDAAGLTQIAPAFGAIHDAIYNYIPEDRADEMVKRHLEIQSNLPFEKVGWNPQLNFPADAKVGPDMGNLEEVK